jgi:hypothetical protein
MTYMAAVSLCSTVFRGVLFPVCSLSCSQNRADDWYDNDDVYIVYADGGYYMFNRRYPGDRIAISVYVN